MARNEGGSPILSQQLLLGVAEELKLPLLQIARQAEQGRLTGQTDLRLIQETADGALRLLDNYALGVRLALDPEHLALESVSVSSVLYNTGQQLDALAKNYGVELELNIAGRFGPVLAHRQGLEAALVSLGAALIEGLPAQDSPQLKLQLATHRSRYGIVAGLYADTKQLSSQALQSGRRLQRRSRQPLVNLSHTSGAGVFVADTILKAMDLHLVASRHHRLYGLGTVLQPNNQLHLV
ncbi:hypothetical protein COY17_03895 [Candidatus Saccharibacteria bacterium CG_4_10_14_0_2_um_filter_52_9]|nr:MAG: hypothetical protein COY17_03895 [Candidatus Saccharibacteria bacterium CG_4_10_14_0_2_um_filter_52_9]